ncbi:hypothetical protein C8Q77DRAFT_1054954 [Trametes polyzona]|nr:hypothetical protein C8Q77DRAFT_1054954 [Trametes polyzona]
MPHTLLTLNYDVLSQVLGLLSPHDAAQLALTSRAAYTLAFPRIVSDVTLGGLYYKPGGSALSQLTAFCNFLLAPAPAWHGPPGARFDALQSLQVMRDAVRVRKNGVWTVDPTAASLLSSVVARAQNLQRLTIWGSEALFAAYPDFCLNSSPSIQTLLLGGDVPTLPILARAFPHIRALEFIGGSGSCAPDWALFTANDTADAEALGAWQQKLDRVDTGFPILPLACPARHVSLRNPLVSDTYMLFCAREFLRRTRPVVLSASASSDLTEEELCAVLDGEIVGPGLRSLELVGDRCGGVKDPVEWTTRVANTLSTLQIPLLGVSISVTPAIPAMTIASALKPNYVPTPVATPASQDDQPDLDALALMFAERAPSLQFIALDLSAAPGAAVSEGAKAWYRAYNAGSQRRVVKLDEAEGMEMSRKMRVLNRWD